MQWDTVQWETGYTYSSFRCFEVRCFRYFFFWSGILCFWFGVQLPVIYHIACADGMQVVLWLGFMNDLFNTVLRPKYEFRKFLMKGRFCKNPSEYPHLFLSFSTGQMIWDFLLKLEETIKPQLLGKKVIFLWAFLFDFSAALLSTLLDASMSHVGCCAWSMTCNVFSLTQLSNSRESRGHHFIRWYKQWQQNFYCWPSWQHSVFLVE